MGDVIDFKLERQRRRGRQNVKVAGDVIDGEVVLSITPPTGKLYLTAADVRGIIAGLEAALTLLPPLRPGGRRQRRK